MIPMAAKCSSRQEEVTNHKHKQIVKVSEKGQGSVWFLCLNGMSNIESYLISKPCKRTEVALIAEADKRVHIYLKGH